MQKVLSQRANRSIRSETCCRGRTRENVARNTNVGRSGEVALRLSRCFEFNNLFEYCSISSVASSEHRSLLEVSEWQTSTESVGIDDGFFSKSSFIVFRSERISGSGRSMIELSLAERLQILSSFVQSSGGSLSFGRSTDFATTESAIRIPQNETLLTGNDTISMQKSTFAFWKTGE